MLSNFCLLSRCFWIGRYSTIFLELCDPMFKYYNTLKRVPFNVVFTFENRYKSRGLIWGGVRSLRRVYQIRINSRSWRRIRAIRFFLAYSLSLMKTSIYIFLPFEAPVQSLLRSRNQNDVYAVFLCGRATWTSAIVYLFLAFNKPFVSLKNLGT